MTIGPRTPAVYVGGAVHSADEVEARASRWHDEIERVTSEGSGPIAVALGDGASGVSLFVAASARPDWFILLPPDARSWGRLTLPKGLMVFLPPSLASLVPTAEALGCAAHVLSADAGSRHVRGAPLTLLRTAGVALFTSGSTAAPKPVFRPLSILLAGVTARLDALGLRTGEGVVAGVSMGHGHGLTRLLSAMCLGGPFGLLAPLDHRGALDLLAQPQFALWSATAHFADVLSRCRLTGPPVVPRVCLISSPVGDAVHGAFRARFGVPLRQNYSSTETGAVAADWGPASEVCPQTVGRPLPGVEIRIGDNLDEPMADGETGRLWIRSPWQMAGYGFPPHVERPGDIDGWWPTRDLGMRRPDGRLMLCGRLDDCIRTREGRLVNLAAIAQSLRGVDGVRAAVVVPVAGPAGASFGALLVCAASATLADVRRRATDALPEWAWPRAIVQVPALPRLPGGKVDRQQCIALLGGRA